MKIQVVISIWDEGVFVLRNNIESNNTSSIREEFELEMNKIENKLIEIEERRRKIIEDDDIPF